MTPSSGDKAGFARRLRAAMWRRGWTEMETARRVREHLGEGAKFGSANISHYATGHCLPQLRYLEALSAVLDLDKDELIGSGLPNRANDSEETPERAGTGLEIQDRGTGVWLQINQQVPWSVGLKILQALKE